MGSCKAEGLACRMSPSVLSTAKSEMSLIKTKSPFLTCRRIFFLVGHFVQGVQAACVYRDECIFSFEG